MSDWIPEFEEGDKVRIMATSTIKDTGFDIANKQGTVISQENKNGGLHCVVDVPNVGQFELPNYTLMSAG